ncbi:hypothetical protein D9M68_719860 [compost metagenome]
MGAVVWQAADGHIEAFHGGAGLQVRAGHESRDMLESQRLTVVPDDNAGQVGRVRRVTEFVKAGIRCLQAVGVELHRGARQQRLHVFPELQFQDEGDAHGLGAPFVVGVAAAQQGEQDY